MIFAFALFLAPSALVAAGVGALAAWDFMVDLLAGPDRRRRITECSAYGGKLAYEVPVVPPPSVVVCERILAAEPVELDRMRSGAAFAEAMACQLAEIRSLPEALIGRSRWS